MRSLRLALARVRARIFEGAPLLGTLLIACGGATKLDGGTVERSDTRTDAECMHEDARFVLDAAGHFGSSTAQHTCISGSVVVFEICNSGNIDIEPGLASTVYVQTLPDSPVACTARTLVPLEVGECSTLSCSTKVGLAHYSSLVLSVNDSGDGARELPECNTLNNFDAVTTEACVPK